MLLKISTGNRFYRELREVKYSETEVIHLLETKGLILEDQVKANILNFIRTIHLNKQPFIHSAFDTEYFGQLPMTFKKESGQVIGLVTATINDCVHQYVFNDQGYEALSDLLQD